ncbi:hypothetical protein Ccrd_003886 [Cynara cardunculus var. scolymus]|uniref:Uncharacterized protein n=1 Tax=Cynara cardunculus var. scolymus TaxID=59895 RepID=A0A118JVH7_CYNCS|nr:hypothetical protein Ccrd_003886 [Cynara cardunculus var. scolymus]
MEQDQFCCKTLSEAEYEITKDALREGNFKAQRLEDTTTGVPDRLPLGCLVKLIFSFCYAWGSSVGSEFVVLYSPNELIVCPHQVLW